MNDDYSGSNISGDNHVCISVVCCADVRDVMGVI